MYASGALALPEERHCVATFLRPQRLNESLFQLFLCPHFFFFLFLLLFCCAYSRLTLFRPAFPMPLVLSFSCPPRRIGTVCILFFLLSVFLHLNGFRSHRLCRFALAVILKVSQEPTPLPHLSLGLCYEGAAVSGTLYRNDGFFFSFFMFTMQYSGSAFYLDFPLLLQRCRPGLLLPPLAFPFGGGTAYTRL